MSLKIVIDPERNMRNASASNDINLKQITIYVNKIHGNSGYKRYAQKINNLFLKEFVCYLTRKMNKDFTPMCEQKPSNYYGCNFPLYYGMRLKIK